ncbi:2-methylcitrate synthase, mitochondrial [Erysiphe neolycopersici]|uniref:Citrate synthase n=1 Tax=Erysiphe neolycopersici TaxID=212602 RepID=A0A420HLB7_9PEZI|nr:2-methylcitrate synthase, mitochondrial [Erysiphe neolycopersici]
MILAPRTTVRNVRSFLGPFSVSNRTYVNITSDIREVFQARIDEKRELLKKVKVHGDKSIGHLKVANVYGGTRGLTSMLWEGSVLDPNEGIRFHGRTIKDCQRELPKGISGTEMLPEAMFLLLLTGDVPSITQTRQFSYDLANNADLPPFVEKLLDEFPKNVHPMNQFAIAVSALSTTSEFASAYEKGCDRSQLWSPALNDCISLLAKLPVIAAKIYQNTYRGVGPLPASIDLGQDWSYNFAAMLGKGGNQNEDFQDFLRLYLALHGDHEGGNVSSHTTHLVGSALSDPFLSYSAGLQGLAGPLHGLAAQEVLRWIQMMEKSIGPDYTDGDIVNFFHQTLKSGKVIPGYGHAVLRRADPRFEALMEYASSRPIANDSTFKLVKRVSEHAPQFLKMNCRIQCPHPNVDASSGVILHYYGFRETLYYTVIFGVSRALGALSQYIWDRALGLPIERPKSINMEGLLKRVEMHSE